MKWNFVRKRRDKGLPEVGQRCGRTANFVWVGDRGDRRPKEVD